MVLFGFGLVLFVPSFLEIRKPKDKGPRKIVKQSLTQLNPLPNARFLEGDLMKISGDAVFPAGAEFKESVVVGGRLTVGDRCHFHKSAKAWGMSALETALSLTVTLSWKETLLWVKVIGGSIDARRHVKLNGRVAVHFSVVSGGNVVMFENSEVAKNIYAQGTIKVLKQPGIGFPSTVDDIG